MTEVSVDVTSKVVGYCEEVQVTLADHYTELHFVNEENDGFFSKNCMERGLGKGMSCSHYDEIDSTENFLIFLSPSQ